MSDANHGAGAVVLRVLSPVKLAGKYYKPGCPDISHEELASSGVDQEKLGAGIGALIESGALKIVGVEPEPTDSKPKRQGRG